MKRLVEVFKGVGVEIFMIGIGSIRRMSLLWVIIDIKYVFVVGYI